jgi:hypothetical protein
MNSNTFRHYADDAEFHNALANASDVQESLDIINAYMMQENAEYVHDDEDSYYTLFDDDSDERQDDDKYGFTDTCNF